MLSKKAVRYDNKAYFSGIDQNKFVNQFISEIQSTIEKVLEPVCCKKRQKKVPDQFLVCGIGDL